MAPSITVISNPNAQVMEAVCMNTLQKYYPVFVDGKSTEFYLFQSKYENSNSRYFKYDNVDWKMYEISELSSLPHFIVNFDQDTVISDLQWTFIKNWVNSVFEGNEDLNEEMFKLLPQPKIIKSEPIKKEINHGEDAYTFRYFIDEERDRAIFEVVKPFTDRPYSSVISPYSKRGMEPFFTSLYVCQSWGVCNHDHLFLLKIWKHLGMEEKYGPLDLENRLKAAIAKCLPDNPGGPEKEPEVYRATIEDCIDMWNNKRQNIDFVDDSENVKKKIKTLF
jgi:hypothetical protein